MICVSIKTSKSHPTCKNFNMVIMYSRPQQTRCVVKCLAGWKSDRLRIGHCLAMVTQSGRKPQVVGSSPTGNTNIFMLFKGFVKEGEGRRRLILVKYNPAFSLHFYDSLDNLQHTIYFIINLLIQCYYDTKRFSSSGHSE